MEKILKYQQLDLQLQQLDRQIASSKEKETMNQMIAYVKEAQGKSLDLEKRAKAMMDEYVQLKNEYDKNFQLIQNIIGKNSNELSTNQMDEIFNQINLVSSNLYMIERNINIQLVNIKNILKEFENTKNGVIKARNKHKESKTKYENLVGTINPQKEKIQKEMLSLESEIDPKVLAKYKSIKRDNIFPVFVPLNNGNCGGCRMALPMGKIDKIKAEGYIVCEQCGRIIYTK